MLHATIAHSILLGFAVVVSERWQHEIAETVFETINSETDKVEQKKRTKLKGLKLFDDERQSDCILHGYIKKLGGPFSAFTSAWQTRYGRLYPNRLELHQEGGKTDVSALFSKPSPF